MRTVLLKYAVQMKHPTLLKRLITKLGYVMWVKVWQYRLSYISVNLDKLNSVRLRSALLVRLAP